MVKIGQIVRQEFGVQNMKVTGFEPELVENVVTEWEDEDGNIFTAKFIESSLEVVDENES